MIHSRATIIVNAPAASVWRVVSDYANDPRWRRGVSAMRQASAPPVHVGAEAEEVLRMLGRTVVSRVVIESLEPDSAFQWRVDDGGAHGRRWVRAIDERSSELGAEKYVTLADSDRLLTPLVGAVIRRTERGDLRRAARLIEALEAG
ncbi:MAG: SRPBCC family protein [Microbacterium sp.]